MSQGQHAYGGIPFLKAVFFRISAHPPGIMHQAFMRMDGPFRFTSGTRGVNYFTHILIAGPLHNCFDFILAGVFPASFQEIVPHYHAFIIVDLCSPVENHYFFQGWTGIQQSISFVIMNLPPGEQDFYLCIVNNISCFFFRIGGVNGNNYRSDQQ